MIKVQSWGDGDGSRLKGLAIVTHASQESPPVNEFLAFAKSTLGDSIDNKTAIALAKIQARLRVAVEQLITRYDKGELGAEAYLEEHTASLRDAMKASEALLGRQRFLRIFGEAGDCPEGLIDRDIFLKQEPEHRRSR
jgi:hypothetical protein